MLLCCVKAADINSEYQADPYYLIALLNVFIGLKPVKGNGNLFDNSTLKTLHLDT